MASSQFRVAQPEDQRIRSAWLMVALTSCQHVSARLPICDRNDARDLLSAFTLNLQLPNNQAEWLVLRGSS